MKSTRFAMIVWLATCAPSTLLAQAPVKPASMPAPNPAPLPARPAPAAADKVSLQLTFVEPSGSTLAHRRVDLSLGKTETVVVQQGSRTVSAETTVVRGSKAGCHRVDVTVRDKTIDSTGHFNKTVWQSGSDPCGPEPIVYGPKDELRLAIAVTPVR